LRRVSREGADQNTQNKKNKNNLKINSSAIAVNAIKQVRAGLFLAVAVIFPHPDAMAGQLPVNLGSTSRFGVLAGSLISSVPTSAINGDVGVSPAARSTITGLTPAEVAGSIFGADDGGAVAVMLTQAKGDLTTAYNDAAGRTPVPTGPFLNPGGGNLSGLNLGPGLYKFTGAALISGSDVTLTGSASDVWIFQIASSLTVANGIHVVLAGGAQAANIYWQVGTSATLGTTVIFKGSILADQSIALHTLAKLDGRALARIAAVTLDSNTVTIPGAATNTMILVSAAEVTGPYTYASGHSVNLETQTITVPALSSRQFYRIRDGIARTITGTTVSGGNLVITYK
jgi:hypothetical protein